MRINPRVGIFFVNFSCGTPTARPRVLVLHLLLKVLFVYFIHKVCHFGVLSPVCERHGVQACSRVHPEQALRIS